MFVENSYFSGNVKRDEGFGIVSVKQWLSSPSYSVDNEKHDM